MTCVSRNYPFRMYFLMVAEKTVTRYTLVLLESAVFAGNHFIYGCLPQTVPADAASASLRQVSHKILLQRTKENIQKILLSAKVYWRLILQMNFTTQIIFKPEQLCNIHPAGRGFQIRYKLFSVFMVALTFAATLPMSLVNCADTRRWYERQSYTLSDSGMCGLWVQVQEVPSVAMSACRHPPASVTSVKVLSVWHQELLKSERDRKPRSSPCPTQPD